MSANRWEDHYTRKAREEQWFARSVYKLREMDQRFRLIQRGWAILDLGCYPGSWSQYSLGRTGPKGKVIGVDRTPPKEIKAPNFRFIQADVLELEPARFAAELGPVDVVLSDLAPSTTGIAVRDTSRSLALAEQALAIAGRVLRPGGHFVCKVFEGEGIRSFRRAVDSRFERTRSFRPRAVRKRSREVYLLGLGLIPREAHTGAGEHSSP